MNISLDAALLQDPNVNALDSNVAKPEKFSQQAAPVLNADGTGEIPGLTYPKKIAQEFPANYSTNGAAVTSFAENDIVWLNPSKYYLGTRGDVTYAQVNTTGGYERVVDALLERKHINDDRPLNTVIISAHGGPGVLEFGDGNQVKISTIIDGLMKKGIIGKGSTVRFAGCLVANTPEARSELLETARKYQVNIVANRDKTMGGIPTLVQYTFNRNGKTTENYLTKPD
jgi:hypothetical protein